MAYRRQSPQPVTEGGTGKQTNTAFAVLCGGTGAGAVNTPIQSIASAGTAGQLLTSNGAAALPTFQAISGTILRTLTGTNVGISVPALGGNINILGTPGVTVVGIPATHTLTITLGGTIPQSFLTDSGTATPTAGVLNIVTGQATQDAGSTIFFSGGPSNIVQLGVTDVFRNTIIGRNAGNGTLTGDENTALGQETLRSLTSGRANVAIGFETLTSCEAGSNNIAIGNSSLGAITTGDSNIAIGSPAGSAYASNESENILLNSTGVVGDTNTLRIGQATGAGVNELDRAFIQGIYGIPPLIDNAVPVVIDSAGQLGTGDGVAFLSYVDASSFNLTGDGTLYTIAYNTEAYDQGNNFTVFQFTTPVAGKYNFSFGVSLSGVTALHTAGGISLVTTNNSFLTNTLNYGAVSTSLNMALGNNICCDMDAGDTARMDLIVSGSTKTIAVTGAVATGAISTYFGGILVQ